MKKRLSVLLSIIIVLSICAPLQSVIAAEVQRRNVVRFCNIVEEMNTEYESDSDSFEANANKNNPNAVEDRLIVKTRNNVSDDTALESVSGFEYTILQYENKQDMEQAYDELREKGYSVEKDRVLSVKDNSLKNLRTTADDSSSDSDKVSDRWSYESVMSDYAKAQIEKSDAYNNEIVIGVLDSGVDYNHELFSGRISDTSFNMSASGNKNDCMDDNGHGTAVAGIIAQTTPDNVKIKPYKIIDADGYVTLSEFTAAMEVILASKDLPDIMNISLGGYLFEKNMSLETELVSRLVEKGVTVCVASGNDDLPVKYCTPADCESAITVGAYDYTNHICSFSNYGKEIDVAAPGYNVYSVDLSSGKYYANYSGTSFACPIASAACSYILMQNPKFSPKEVQEQIKTSAVYMGEDEENYYGSGMLNFPNLLVDKEHTAPIPSTVGGFYTDTQTVTFDNIPADTQLIYTLDKSIPSTSNGTVYTSPITIDNEIQLNYALIQSDKYVSDIKSQYYTVQYIADENDFEITEDGVITAYNGNKNNIIVPNTIQGIIPTQLKAAFDSSNITSAVLPDSVTKLVGHAFSDSEELKYVTAQGVTSTGTSFINCYSLRYLDAPKIESISQSAFENCSMMNKINFENSLKSHTNYAFKNSGLLSINLSDIKVKNQHGYMGVFESCPLINCSITGVEVLGTQYFANCHFLQELYIPDVIELGQYAIRECDFLTKIDLPNLETAIKGSFAYCYLDTLYAPKLNKIISGTYSSLGITAGSFIRIVDLPALTSASRLLCSMYVEEIYLENLETMTADTFSNLPMLKVVYLPKVQTYYRTAVNKHENLNQLGPTEIFWIPQAELDYSVLNIPDETKLMFAPSTSRIHFDSYDTTFVISEKATDVAVGVTKQSYLDNVYPTIIAPKGSAAWSQWQYSDEDPIKYIDSDSIIEAKGAQIRTRDNGLRFGFVLDESVLGVDLSQYENLYKRINKEYGFAYSFDQSIDEQNENVNTQIRADNDDTLTAKAAKRTVDGLVSTYNAVFTGIPKSHFDDKISARAYVNIDGMYFYSPVITRSYSSASNADDYVGIEEADNDIVFVHEHSFVKSVIAPKCEEKGYTLYKCAKCNESYTENYVDALGHNYKFVSADNSKLTYKCSDCDSTVIKTKSELPIFIDCVNTKVVRGNDNMYLDLNNDGYINAKDYALLNKISN